MQPTKHRTSVLILMVIITIMALLSMAGVYFMTQTTLLDNYMLQLFGAAAEKAG